MIACITRPHCCAKSTISIIILGLILFPLLTGCSSSGGEQAASGGAVKFIEVFVDRAGIYLLSPEVFRAAGWNSDDLSRLKLTNLGEDVGYWSAEGSAGENILFWGQEYHSRYTHRNVYRLEIGSQSGSTRIHSGLTGGDSPTESMQISTEKKRLHLEQNLIYTPQITDGDPFVWEKITAPAKKEIEFSAVQVADGSGELQLNVWASTGAENSNGGKQRDHRMLVEINGQKIIDETFSGKGRVAVSGTIPQRVIRDGKNLMELTLPGSSGSLVDIIQLDWIEIAYERSLVLSDELLFFSSSGTDLSVRFENDSRGMLVDISQPNLPVIIHRDRRGSFTFKTEIGKHFVYVPEDDWITNADYRLVFQQEDLLNGGYRADYLLIGDSELLTGANLLLEHRTLQGYSTQAIPLEWIFDQYSFGIFDPQAIRDFLYDAYAAEVKAPKYVLLLGDFSYDSGGLLAKPPAHMLPGMFVQTGYGGETIGDASLGMIDDDQLPDIAIGRIPGGTANEIRAVVEKIISYETQAQAGSARNRMLVIADRQDARFNIDAQEFAGWFAGALVPDFFPPPGNLPEPAGRLIERFGDDYLFVSYFGHGSLSQWGKDAIISSEEAVQLTNREHLPIVINLTCLTGYYIHPKVRSLAEHLLLNPEGGAVAMIAPSSLTLPDDQRVFSKLFAEAYVNNPTLTLGELFLIAQRSLPVDRNGTREVLLTYMLFGDPALRLPATPAP